MQFIAFSDIHFDKNHNKSTVSVGGYTTWMENQEDIIDQIVDYAKEHKVENIFFGGDLFEKKNYLPQDLYNFVWDIFAEHAVYGNLIFHLNTGNHDYHSKVSSSLKPFSKIVNVYNKPEDVFLHDGVVRMLPHGMVDKNLGIPPRIDETVVFTHEDIADLVYGPTDYKSGSRYKPEIFGDWSYVFNGHIHTPQRLKNIVNMGSCMRQNFSETEDKFFYHYKDGLVKPISIKCPEFVTLSGFSEKIRTVMEKDTYNFYRIDIASEELIDPIFKQFNIFPNIVKFSNKKKRIETDMSEEEELIKYMEIVESNLDPNKLLKLVEGLNV